MSAKTTAYTDLTVIKGIGPARQQWLREALQVHTLQDLAALSPHVIEAHLKTEGRIAARSEIEAWITQAQELTATALSPVSATSAPPMTKRKAPATAPKADTWKAFAQFGVEFLERHISTADMTGHEYQTAARHIETGHSAVWPGLESQPLCAWLLEQISPTARPAPVVASMDSVPPLSLPLTVMLRQVRAFQSADATTPIASGTPVAPMQGMINGVAPVVFEVVFDLAEPVAGDLAAQISYHVQCHLYNQITGASIHLVQTESRTLVAGQTTYATRLPSTTLLPGLYRLQVLVSLQSRPPRFAHFEIPVMHVV